MTKLFAIFLLLSNANAYSSETSAMFDKAKTDIEKFIPDAYLAYYKGKLSKEPGCEEMIEWRFVFKEDASSQRPETGGFVDYSYRSDLSNGCVLQSRTVVDTYINLPSYYYLARNGDVAKVLLEPRETVEILLKSYPHFDWAKSFEVYTPMVPEFKDRVFYAVLGMISGNMIEVIVDASNGEIVH